MNSDQVKELLGISLATLKKLRDLGKLPAIKLPNGNYEWDENEVYRYMSRGSQPENYGIYLYARISSDDSDENLFLQIQKLKEFAMENFIQVSGEFHEKATATDFKNRDNLVKILYLAESGKLKKLLLKNPLILGETNLFQKFLSEKYGVSFIFTDKETVFIKTDKDSISKESEEFYQSVSNSPIIYKRIAEDVLTFSKGCE